MRVIYLGLWMLLWSFSCSSQKSANIHNGSSNSTTTKMQEPLFSPIQMQVGGVDIELKDYFPLFKNFSVSQIPEGLQSTTTAQTIHLTGNLLFPLDFLRLEVDGEKFDILVKNHDKIPYKFQFKPNKTYKDIQIKGSFNGWNTTANPFSFSNGIYSFDTWLSPGTYEYIFVSEGKEFNDPNNPNVKSNGMGGINNTFQVGKISNNQPFQYVKEIDEKHRIIHVKLIQLSPESLKHNFLVFWENTLLLNSEPFLDSDRKSMALNIQIPVEAKDLPRSFIRVFSYDNSQVLNDLLIPIEYGKPIKNASNLNRKDLQDNVMYEVFVDRFYDGDPQNNHPLHSPELFKGTDWYGGDLQGMYKKMKEGYFTQMGFNSLWISPIIKNPKGMYGHMQEYGVDTRFTGYHGYWPIDLKHIDNRFGTSEVLKNIIVEAHSQDTNVLLDYVANHVHEEHPIVANHLGWTTPLMLPDGRKNIRLYDEQRLTTWFDEFMPSLDLERDEVAQAMSDSAIYWFKYYDIDGFRHDATKHIPNSFWRILTYKLKTQVSLPQHRSIYQIGETYGSNELINSYINTGMLDAQFNFNLYDATINGLMNETYSLENTHKVLEEGLKVYGAHNLMGNISGNHDKGRSISYADGSLSFNESAKEAGYTRKIDNINGELGFKKMAQMFAFNFFVPGIPVVYYGDEIGMPGGDDPDNRRMMQFTNLNPNQLYLKEKVTKLIHYRRQHLELIYGDTKVLFSDATSIVILRTYDGNSSVLFINKSDQKRDFQVEIPMEVPHQKVETLEGNVAIFQQSKLWVSIPARGFDIIHLE